MPNTIADPVRITQGGTITDLDVGLSLTGDDTIASIDDVTITPSIPELTVSNVSLNANEVIIGGRSFAANQSVRYDLTFSGTVYGGAIAANVDFKWDSVDGDTLTDTVDVELRRALTATFSTTPSVEVITSGAMSYDLIGVADGATNLGAFEGSTIADNETVKGALTDLEAAVESNDTDIAAIQVRLVSDHTNAETDLGITPNSATSRQTLTQDPGSSVRTANTTALNGYFNSINTAPSVHKTLYFPNGSFAFNTLDPSSYQVAFKNFTLTGTRPEYAAQHIETGTGTPEWGSRIDIYNTADTDYWIDVPGSFSDKSLRPSMINIRNLVFNLGNAYAALGSSDWSSMKGGILRIGDRDQTGKQDPNYTQDLARGVFLSGCYFTDLRVSKSNPTYHYLPQQADGTNTIYTNDRALVEMNRVYDLTVNLCAFRGGLGPQLHLTTCDRPLVMATRHFLAYIGISNACKHYQPPGASYYRDFMDGDGVPGSYIGCYVEQPALAGVLASGGMWSDMRIEGGYQKDYLNDWGPGYYPMPSTCSWSISFRNLAGADPALNEEQYIQFANLPASIIPYNGASSRAPTIADYIQPGMVLKLTPSSPSTYGFKQRPVTNLLVTAVDATNNRVYWYGGYRANNQTGVGVAALGMPTSGGTPVEVMSGSGADCVRMIGIPFVGAGSRLGLSNNSIMINATPGSNNPEQPLPVPRMALSFDRTVVSVNGIVGNNGAHTEEEDRDSFRPVICTTNWGGASHQGAGVAFQGCLPPEHPHAKVYGSGELEDWPRNHLDNTGYTPDDFDFFTSPEHTYILGNNDWMLQFHMVEGEDGKTMIPCYDTSTNFWEAFNAIPADEYEYTIRFWSPKQIGSATASTIVRQNSGTYTGNCLFTFPTAHNFSVDQVVDVGGTGVGGYNTTHTVREVPSPTTMVTSVAYISDVAQTMNITIRDPDRLAINYRLGSGDGSGVNVLYPPTGVDFTQVMSGWNTITGTFPAGTTDVFVYNGSKKLYKIAWIGLKAKSTRTEIVTAGTVTLSVAKSTEIDSSSGAVTATLGSGQYVGQIKTIVMTNAANASTVTVTNHETSDPEVFTFDAVDEFLVLVWTGTEWATIKATATAV